MPCGMIDIEFGKWISAAIIGSGTTSERGST
jgi:hypothetical protein